MAYLIDTSSLIELRDRGYGFDLCPGFWEWLAQRNAAGFVYSVAEAKRELLAGNDDLAEWAARTSGFFLPHRDPATVQCMVKVSDWVEQSDFKREHKAVFMNGADPWLIACAMARGYTVVTDEVFIQGQRNKIKIPRVCKEFDVPYTTLLSMLRESGAAFVLPCSGRHSCTDGYTPEGSLF